MQKLAPAFVAAKKSFGPALKDKNNPAFRSKYADLGACIDAVEDALLANGIAFYQETSEDATGVTVETVFLHESGETLRCGKLHVPASKQDPQGYGSALTYARRYSLMASCGIAPEDDDGNAASKGKPKQGGVTVDAAVISAPRMAFESLPADWQSWLKDFAPTVELTMEQRGATKAQEEIDRAIEEYDLQAEHITGLWSLLTSKTRTALKPPKAKEAK